MLHTTKNRDKYNYKYILKQEANDTVLPFPFSRQNFGPGFSPVYVLA